MFWLLGVVYNWPESLLEWRPVAVAATTVRLSASCSSSNHPTSPEKATNNNNNKKLKKLDRYDN